MSRVFIASYINHSQISICVQFSLVYYYSNMLKVWRVLLWLSKKGFYNNHISATNVLSFTCAPPKSINLHHHMWMCWSDCSPLAPPSFLSHGQKNFLLTFVRPDNRYWYSSPSFSSRLDRKTETNSYDSIKLGEQINTHLWGETSHPLDLKCQSWNDFPNRFRGGMPFRSVVLVF